tara:strand:- start:688 stop:999 length:312 start_codon:yes stop_codon:yes gene_type:complete
MRNLNNFNKSNFNVLYFIIPLVISGLLIINASKDNGGIPVLNSLSKKIHVSENKLRQLDNKIAIIQNKVDLIKGPEIDADLLEELAYEYLGFSYSKDLFIPID